jgi:hypothetical protein
MDSPINPVRFTPDARHARERPVDLRQVAKEVVFIGRGHIGRVTHRHQAFCTRAAERAVLKDGRPARGVRAGDAHAVVCKVGLRAGGIGRPRDTPERVVDRRGSAGARTRRVGGTGERDPAARVPLHPRLHVEPIEGAHDPPKPIELRFRLGLVPSGADVAAIEVVVLVEHGIQPGPAHAGRPEPHVASRSTHSRTKGAGRSRDSPTGRSIGKRSTNPVLDGLAIV